MYHLKIGTTNWHVADRDKIFINGNWEVVEITPESLNMQLKAVYFCATNQHRWGKGLTIADAKKAAGLTTKTHEKKCEFYVMAVIFNEPTKDELDNLLMCITANQIDGSPQYYKDERTAEDTKMISEKHLGWLTVEKNY